MLLRKGLNILLPMLIIMLLGKFVFVLFVVLLVVGVCFVCCVYDVHFAI